MERMTSRQHSQWERYLSSITRYGQRDIGDAYNSFSSKKFNAWDSIRHRSVAEKGFGLTVTSAGSHYFSTDYIVRVKDKPHTYEWVHDSASGTQRLPLDGKMIGELKLVGIYDPWSW